MYGKRPLRYSMLAATDGSEPKLFTIVLPRKTVISFLVAVSLRCGDCGSGPGEGGEPSW